MSYVTLALGMDVTHLPHTTLQNAPNFSQCNKRYDHLRLSSTYLAKNVTNGLIGIFKHQSV